MTWRAVVRAGGHPFTVDEDEAPEYGLTQLTRTESLDEGDPWPGWVTTVLEVGLVVPSWAALEGVGKGSLVSAWWGSVGGSVPIEWRFDGIATDVQGEPHPLGVLVTITAVDHVTSALDIKVNVDRPSEQAVTRLAALMALTGLPWVDYSFLAPWHTFTAVDEPQVSLLEYVRDLTDQYAIGTGATALARVGINATVARDAGGVWADEADGGTLTGFRGDIMPRDPRPDTLPGFIGPTPEVPRSDGAPGTSYGVTFPAGPGERATSLVPAGYVEMASRYTDDSGGSPNRVAVSWEWAGDKVVTVTSNGETPPVTMTIETDIVTSLAVPTQPEDAARRTGDLYTPRAGASTWQADEFRWLLGREAIGEGPLWHELGALVAVAPVLSVWSPTGRPWYAGALTRTSFTIEDGLAEVRLRIGAQRHRMAENVTGPVTPATINPAITVGALNGRDTVADWELARGDLTP